MTLFDRLQKLLMDFFWKGYHWLQWAVQYLPTSEGSQDLINLWHKSRGHVIEVAVEEAFAARLQKPSSSERRLCRVAALNGKNNLPSYEGTPVGGERSTINKVTTWSTVKIAFILTVNQ
ncbi:hypothetical protein Y1Q_0021701 [Alligator mississippiensis]|uniref:Uncharacterized protein n=1 Tax=Alligator mississippiensis TaxID=8496 RepID=A0A151PAT2_ALLMI|nr:hypothetical protein Y1Q_0021701 [Alligator mississippiensis]